MSGRPLPGAFAAVALLMLACAHAARAQAPPGEAAAVEEASAEATVATTMSASERMLVPVTIGGAGPYPFIVDTAAESSVISRELARELGLAADGRARMLSMTSTRDFRMVRIPNVSFLEGQTRTLRAFALDGENLGASGVLGIDALRGQR
ncbi:MAG: retropepsin-like aspartic protease, partial [Vitreimonas sp.]